MQLSGSSRPSPLAARGLKRWAAVAGVVASAAAGCGSRCAEVAARRNAILERTQVAVGPHAEVRIPLARANAFLAALVHDQPLHVPIATPEIGPFAVPAVTAMARDVELEPAPAGVIRFAIRIEIDEANADQAIGTIGVVAEVKPELVRTADGTDLVAGFGSDSVLAVKPELAPESGHALVDVVSRWLPEILRATIPRSVLEGAARQLGDYLTGEAYELLRLTLLRQLGELTRLRLRLPALPIAQVALAETTDALTLELTTDLPVRRGLAARRLASDDVEVRISASTAAELANWSLDHGYLPQHYTRDLDPVPDGEYRPRFDYVAEAEPRPAKIHLFQDRGGCSYFEVGMALQVDAANDKVNVTMHDRRVESVDASPWLEAALWLKQLIFGSVDSARHAAARTRLSVGDRAFVTRVVRAGMTGGELAIALRVVPEPTVAARTPAR